MNWTHIVVALIGLAGIIIPIILKMLSENRKHFELHEKLDNLLKDVQKDIRDNEKENLRTRIILMLRFDRWNATGILEARDKYVTLGGNGNIKHECELWQKWYDKEQKSYDSSL